MPDRTVAVSTCDVDAVVDFAASTTADERRDALAARRERIVSVVRSVGAGGASC